MNEAGEEIPVKIYESYVVRESSLTQPEPSGSGVSPVPGTLSTDGKNWIQVRCGRDVLRITELQVAGKKRMDVASFLLGFRDLEKNRMG